MNCLVYVLAMSCLCLVYVLSLFCLCVVYVLSMCYLCLVYALFLCCLCVVYVLSMCFICVVYVLSKSCLFLVLYTFKRLSVRLFRFNNLTICPLLHFFHGAGLRSGFFHVKNLSPLVADI